VANHFTIFTHTSLVSIYVIALPRISHETCSFAGNFFARCLSSNPMLWYISLTLCPWSHEVYGKSFCVSELRSDLLLSDWESFLSWITRWLRAALNCIFGMSVLLLGCSC